MARSRIPTLEGQNGDAQTPSTEDPPSLSDQETAIGPFSAAGMPVLDYAIRR
jgi:hypothetical protein